MNSQPRWLILIIVAICLGASGQSKSETEKLYCEQTDSSFSLNDSNYCEPSDLPAQAGEEISSAQIADSIAQTNAPIMSVVFNYVDGYKVIFTPFAEDETIDYLIKVADPNDQTLFLFINDSPLVFILEDECLLLPQTNDFKNVANFETSESPSIPIVICKDDEGLPFDATSQHLAVIQSLRNEFCPMGFELDAVVKRAVMSNYFPKHCPSVRWPKELAEVPLNIHKTMKLRLTNREFQ